MANRIPTYVDAISEKISEVPAGDFLSTEGNGFAEGHVALSGTSPSVALNAGGAFSLASRSMAAHASVRTRMAEASFLFAIPPARGDEAYAARSASQAWTCADS